MIINELKGFDEIHNKFIKAKPFPHVAIDNFFKNEFYKNLPDILDNFYSKKKDIGKEYSSDVEKKWGSTGLDLPKELFQIQKLIQSEDFLFLLQEITGLKNLKLTENINGKGFSFFHASEKGSYLGPHLDHTRDLNNGPYHVANIIMYVSQKWKLDWGGSTQLYNHENLKEVKDIYFKPNRALIFLHSPYSIHGTSKISDAAECNRYSFYYDFYSSEDNPYNGIYHVDKKYLHGSPHTFFLSSRSEYLKYKNIRYTMQHLRGFYGFIKHNLFNPKYNK